MKKNFEYKEPEFKVVVTNSEDVITTSGLQNNTLGKASNAWNSANWGDFGTFTL